MTTDKTDFRFINHGSVVTVVAVSEAAKEFAAEAFKFVEDWQGTPEQFTTDWRVARDIFDRLHAEEDFVIEGGDPLVIWPRRTT